MFDENCCIFMNLLIHTTSSVYLVPLNCSDEQEGSKISGNVRIQRWKEKENTQCRVL
jgi:hypothetical protein